MFVRIRLDHLVCLCLLAGVSVFAHAQNTSGKTLGNMIDQAKRQQAQAFNPAPPPPPKLAALPARKPPPGEVVF